MSERERWIVYPLLFLTLGVAMRDKMLKRVGTDAIIAEHVQAGEVVCERLVIRSRSGRPAVAITEDLKTRSGRIETYNQRQQVTGVLGVQNPPR